MTHGQIARLHAEGKISSGDAADLIMLLQAKNRRVTRGVAFAVGAVLGVAIAALSGCYKTLPPCTPDRVDWPRCNGGDVPFPAKAKPDGGARG